MGKVDEHLRDMDPVFVYGEWEIYSARRYPYVYTAFDHIIRHECEECRRSTQDDPWLWGADLEVPCPDCGGVCPPEVVTVWEFLK